MVSTLVFVVPYLARNGFSLASLETELWYVGANAVVILLAYMIDTRVSRPVQSYCWLALVSLVGFMVLMLATGSADRRSAVAFWFLLTCMGTIWTYCFERSEPLTDRG